MERHFSSNKVITIKELGIGPGFPIRVESMASAPSSDDDALLAQLLSLEKAGCELARVAAPSHEDLDVLKKILQNIKLPLMADIHFDHTLAIGAIEAGFPAIRINPGNIGGEERLWSVVDCAKMHRTIIRVGANAGSLNKKQIDTGDGDIASALAHAVIGQVKMLESLSFYDIIVSAKATDIDITLRANRVLRKTVSYPFHVGITEAGYGIAGIVKSSIGLGRLLSEGIGETIRVSLTGPPEDEVEVGFRILQTLGLRNMRPEIISCPTCGRKRIDVESIVKDILKISHLIPAGTKLAVMGCEVNGPREAKDADIGIAGSESGAVIFRKGEVIMRCSSDEAIKAMLDALKESAK